MPKGVGRKGEVPKQKRVNRPTIETTSSRFSDEPQPKRANVTTVPGNSGISSCTSVNTLSSTNAATAYSPMVNVAPSTPILPAVSPSTVQMSQLPTTPTNIQPINVNLLAQLLMAAWQQIKWLHLYHK